MKLWLAVYFILTAVNSLEAQFAHGVAENKVILFTNIHSTNCAFVKFSNDSTYDVNNIRVHANCGCVKIQNYPTYLRAHEEGYLTLLFSNPFDGGRKLNTLLIEGEPMFVKKIELVNYFFSEHPQVLGDTIIHLPEICLHNSSKNIVILGDNSLSNVNISLVKNPHMTYELSPILPLANGCFKRILKITLEAQKLLKEGKTIVQVRVDNNNVIASID